MLATIDQSVEMKASSLTKATFDEEHRTIQATVIISPGEEPGTFHHHVSPLSIVGPGGLDWTVIWTLEASEGLSASFVGNGIIVPKPGTRLPGGVFSPNPTKISAIEAQLTFTNYVTDVNVIRYDFDLYVESGVGELQKHLIIDPTIAVVKDPIEG